MIIVEDTMIAKLHCLSRSTGLAEALQEVSRTTLGGVHGLREQDK